MILLTREPLDPQSLADRVRHASNGAVVTFLGTTRDRSRRTCQTLSRYLKRPVRLLANDPFRFQVIQLLFAHVQQSCQDLSGVLA